MKTFHELNEAFPSLLDENGDRKPFEKFLKDVRSIDDTYNGNYLRAEYNFVHTSAAMAGKWEQFQQDGDRYYLQYRTQHDDKVRPEHAALDGVTLPITDPFWESYYPPNGWNCRCTVAQVRKNKYPATSHEEAMDREREALESDTHDIFRFNSGKQQKSVPDYNPYTIRRCNDCDVAGGKINLAYMPDYQLCRGCVMIRKCYEEREKANGRENLIKRTAEEKHLIYTQPLEQQFEKVYGKSGSHSVSRHILKGIKDMDYNRVLDAAIALVKYGDARILPEIHRSETEVRNRLGLPKDKNPDLALNGLFIDVKSPFACSNICSNANKACVQGAIACITDHLCRIDKSKIRYYAKKVLADKNYDKDTVFFLVEGVLYKYTTADLE